MNTKYLIVISFALLFSSCASLPVYRTSSLDNDKFFESGREVISKENNKFRILVNFESQSGSDLIFYLTVYNNSNEAIIFDPSVIYAEIKQASYPEKLNRKIFVTNPEDEIGQIDKDINRTNSKESFNTGVYLLGSFASLAESIATIGKNKTDEQIEEENRACEDLQNSMENNKAEYDEKMNSLNQQKNYWEIEALRKTTLKGNENVSGYIHLKVNSDILLFNLIIPIGNDKFEFRYKLIEI